jgi:hypothetical protein
MAARTFKDNMVAPQVPISRRFGTRIEMQRSGMSLANIRHNGIPLQPVPRFNHGLVICGCSHLGEKINY